MGKFIDLTGQTFGRLTVIARAANNSSGRVCWLCQCECGNKKIATSHELRRGDTKSCGCLRKETAKKHAEEMSLEHDLTGKTFGMLYVKARTEKRVKDSGNVIYTCVCKCGNIIEVSSSSLISHRIYSCGCILSKGETKISQILRENNISFEQQKTYDDCKSPGTEYPLRFDFLIDNKYIIEYDGQQHFKYTGSGWDTKEHFEKTQKYDAIKNQYCKDNNIPLIRIPYTQYDDLCLEDLLLETSQYILK